MFVNAAAAVQGNLEISVSRLQNPFTHWPPWPLKNVRIKQFGSPAELEKAILASACVVPFPPVHVEGLGYCIECACTRLLVLLMGKQELTVMHSALLDSVCMTDDQHVVSQWGVLGCTADQQSNFGTSVFSAAPHRCSNQWCVCRAPDWLDAVHRHVQKTDELLHPCSQPLLFISRRHCSLAGKSVAQDHT